MSSGREAKWRDALTVEDVRSAAEAFAAARNWQQFHTPRNLLCALVGEVGELSACFQWKGEVAPALASFTEREREHVGEELSDVLVYLVRLADMCGTDLPSAVRRKMRLNAEKYPESLAWGSSAKYDQLDRGDGAPTAGGAEHGRADGDVSDGPEAEQSRGGEHSRADGGGVGGGSDAERHESELSMRSYWNEYYGDELTSLGDGVLRPDWFAEHNGEDGYELASYVLTKVAHACGEHRRLIDVGFGSGRLLLSMERAGWRGSLVGIDYSPEAVRLAETLLAESKLATRSRYTFRNKDIFDDRLVSEVGTYDVVVDKGTLDAVSLSPPPRRLEEYVAALHGLLNDSSSSRLVITSCNLSRAELMALLAPRFEYCDERTYPEMTFGGVSGSPMCTLVMAPKTL